MSAPDYGEPWEVEYGNDEDPRFQHSNVVYAINARDDQVVETDNGAYPPEKDRAERIVRCVNACAGIKSEDLAEVIKKGLAR